MTTRVEVDERALAAAVLSSPGAQRAALDTANVLKSAAQTLSPEGERHGYYRRRFRTAKIPGGARLMNVDAFAHLVEWGSANNRPYAPMRRAARALGLRFVEKTK